MPSLILITNTCMSSPESPTLAINENSPRSSGIRGFRRSSTTRKLVNWLRLPLWLVALTALQVWNTPDREITFANISNASDLQYLAQSMLLATSFHTDESNGIPMQNVTATQQSNSIQRSRRFPSVAERVQLYMSDWYDPPCRLDRDGFGYRRIPKKGKIRLYHTNTTTLEVNSTVRGRYVFYGSLPTVRDCATGSVRVELRHQVYCQDILASFVPAIERLGWSEDTATSLSYADSSTPPPFLFQLGDSETPRHMAYVPHLKKFRRALDHTKLQLSATSSQCFQGNRRAHPSKPPSAILWKLNVKRHYRQVYDVSYLDVPWEEKLEKAIFWGGPNGFTGDQRVLLSITDDLERCLAIPRCQLVYEHANSTVVEAKLTTTRGLFPDTVRGVLLAAGRRRLQDLLRYKALVMLEGNDVSSGLKWAMYSKSVVIMPRPTRTSWLMEELLQPWIHYVPIRDDLSDLEDQTRWVLEHSEEAQRIAERATTWMDDLLFHVDAKRDDEQINAEILRRYAAHFYHKVASQKQHYSGY